MNKCQACGKDTANKKFCSRSCAQRVNNSTSPKRQRTRKFGTCKRCHSQFEITTSERLCALCVEKRLAQRETHRLEREAAKTLTLQHFFDKAARAGKQRSWYFAEVRNLNRAWNAHLRTRCQVCGYDKHVELAHVTALHKFDPATTLDVVNAESNVLALCPNHHWEFDAGVLPLESVPTRR